MNKTVEQALIAIFKAAADAFDGDNVDPEDVNRIKRVYKKVMKNSEVLEFYGELVDSNPLNMLIE